MTKIWTVAAQKGGVGKTTAVVSLADSLTRRGHRVLMVDLDPHGSLSGYFGLDCDVVEPNAYALFDAVANGARPNTRACIHRDLTPGRSLIPGSTALVSLDRRYGQRRDDHDGIGLVYRSVPTRQGIRGGWYESLHAARPRR